MNNPGVPEEDVLIAEYESTKQIYSGGDTKLIVSHIGNVNQEIIISITYFIENQLEIAGESKTIIKKICNVAIESLQNILFHAEKNEQGFHLAFFVIGKNEGEYVAHACNHIKNEDINSMNANLAEIKGMDVKRLNQHYLKKLSEGHISEKGRAGLGLITIALKADNQIDCHIQRTSDNYSIFSIKARITG